MTKEPRIVTEEDKIKVLTYCKNHIKKYGVIRAGFGLQAVQASENFYFIPNSSQQKDFFESLIANLMSSGEYIKEGCKEEKYQYDYNIYKNPNYVRKGFWQKHPFYEKLAIAIISGAISLTVGLTISKQSKQSQTLKDKQQDSLIKDVSDSVSIFRKHITDSNLHK